MAWNKISVFLNFILLFTTSFSFAKTQKSNPTFFYGPEPISLAGVIHSRTFPGPPNYESIANGDEKEDSLIFDLEKPISVLPRKENPMEYGDEPETNVRKLHLVIYHDRKIRVPEGKRVKATGTLMHSCTHSPLIIELMY